MGKLADRIAARRPGTARKSSSSGDSSDATIVGSWRTMRCRFLVPSSVAAPRRGIADCLPLVAVVVAAGLGRREAQPGRAVLHWRTGGSSKGPALARASGPEQRHVTHWIAETRSSKRPTLGTSRAGSTGLRLPGSGTAVVHHARGPSPSAMPGPRSLSTGWRELAFMLLWHAQRVAQLVRDHVLDHPSHDLVRQGQLLGVWIDGTRLKHVPVLGLQDVVIDDDVGVEDLAAARITRCGPYALGMGESTSGSGCAAASSGSKSRVFPLSRDAAGPARAFLAPAASERLVPGLPPAFT